MAYVTIRIKGEDGHRQEDLTAERTVLGRADDSDCCIKHDSISRQHCALIRLGENWYLDDLGSSNGSRINDKQIHERTLLRERDIIKIGKARITFHAGERKARKRPDDDGISVSKDLLADAGGNAAVHKSNADDPPEAIACDHCGTWFSIAHRLAGDTMSCPGCGRAQTVPQLVN